MMTEDAAAADAPPALPQSPKEMVAIIKKGIYPLDKLKQRRDELAASASCLNYFCPLCAACTSCICCSCYVIAQHFLLSALSKTRTDVGYLLYHLSGIIAHWERHEAAKNKDD